MGQYPAGRDSRGLRDQDRSTRTGSWSWRPSLRSPTRCRSAVPPACQQQLSAASGDESCGLTHRVVSRGPVACRGSTSTIGSPFLLTGFLSSSSFCGLQVCETGIGQTFEAAQHHISLCAQPSARFLGSARWACLGRALLLLLVRGKLCLEHHGSWRWPRRGSLRGPADPRTNRAVARHQVRAQQLITQDEQLGCLWNGRLV